MSARTAEPLLSNLVTLGAARGGVLCMNLITTSHMAQALGAANFGLNSFAISYVAYFMIVVNLGYETFITREVAFDRSRMAALVDSMLTMRLILAALMSLLLIGSLEALHLTPTGRIVLLIQAVNIFGSALALASVYQGLQRMRVVAQREFMASAVSMTGVLLLVHGPEDIVLAAVVSAATVLISNVTILIRYVGEYGMPKLHLPNRFDAEQARMSLTYFWSVLMITITYNVHLVLLELMRNDAEVGLFSVGWKLFNFAVVVPNLISTLFLPRIAMLASNPAARAYACEIYIQTCIVCGIPIAFIGEALVPQILAVLFGPAYLPAANTVSLLLLNALIVTLNIGFGTPLLALGRQKAYLRAVAWGAAAGVVLCAALIPPFGTNGAALGTLADEIVLLGLFVAARPEVSITATLEFGLRCLIAVVPAALCAHFAPRLEVIVGSDFAGLIAGGSTGIVVYLLVLRLLRIDVMDFVTGLKRLQ